MPEGGRTRRRIAVGVGFVLDFISVRAHGVQPSERVCEPQIAGHWPAAHHGTGVKPSAVNNVETTKQGHSVARRNWAAISPFLLPLLLAMLPRSAQLDVGHAV